MIHYNYIITNNINNKQYVGAHSTNNIDDDYLGSGLLITRAKKKYGKENFTRKILYTTKTIQEAFHNEELFIIIFNTISPFGYNISPTGGTEHNGSHSEETKQNMSELITIHKENEEKKVEKEDLQNYLDNGWELGFSEEHRQNIREVTDHKGEKNPMYNKHHSKEARKKNSESHKGMKYKKDLKHE